MDTLSYPYKPKPFTMLWAVLFFGVCFFAGWHVATTSTEEVVVLGWRLAPDEARIVFGGVAAVSAVFVALGITGLVAGLVSPRQLTLTDSDLTAPKYPFSRTSTVVPFSSVQRIDLQAFRNQRFLHVYHSDGRLTVTQSYLPNAEAFERVRSALARHVRNG